MGSALTRERVRGDLEVLARAGLDVATFAAEADVSLRRAVPHDGTCVGVMDPATGLLTATYKFGDLQGRDERDDEWGRIEYGGEDPTAFQDLLAGTGSAVAMQLRMGRDIDRSPRMRDLITPYYGYSDELRLVARHGGRAWGGLALFRGPAGPAFTEDEVAFLESLSTTWAAALRLGLLARVAHQHAQEISGPAVIVVGPDGKYRQQSVGAQAVLDALGQGTFAADATGIVAGLVAGARRYAAGTTTVLPRCRVRLATGRWLVLHASPLAGIDGSTGDVVVTAEEARPPEIVPLVVAAFELTPRERDVTQLVLQSVDTKEIAATLHMSPYTVQDHLKSVFEKAGVRSRRELIARVYFDQYVPRMGAELAPSGWFAGS